MLDFLIGCAVGSVVVGASVWRTLAVHEADMAGAWWSGIMNSVAYYYSVHFVAHDNLVAYTGTAVGSTLTIVIMAYRKKRKNKGVKRG